MAGVVIAARTQGLDFVTARFYLFMLRSNTIDPNLASADGRLRVPARQSEENCQTACKPGSVPPRDGDGHSSGTSVAGRLERPTRTAARKHAWAIARPTVPIWSCSRWGLPCRSRYRERGALLPHPFTLAAPAPSRALAMAVCFLWHCPWGRPRRPLAGTVFPWSPDFPPPAQAPGAAIRPSGES